MQSDQMGAYTEAVKSGLYAKKTGLVGKYDNVRRLWEDELTGQFLYPYLRKLIGHCRDNMRRIRIMDLGCGSADGYELLRSIRDVDANLHDAEAHLLSSQNLGLYQGIDLNDDLLEQAEEVYGNDPKVRFDQADFSKGLPLEDDAHPFDLYFSSFGTCSHHNDDDTLVNLIVDIAERSRDQTLIVCDWLGRYSYEWQELWTKNLKQERNMDYVVSYIYDDDERDVRRDELEHLYLRVICREEIDDILARVRKRTKKSIEPLGFFDRSAFVGRHIDTGEYNSLAQPIRRAVNSLFEVNVRTNFEDLLIDYFPKEGFDFLNSYYEHFVVCWNELVRHVGCLIELFDEKALSYEADPPAPPPASPPILRQLTDRMNRVVEGTGWFKSGLPRENVIEPQLAYALRQLEVSLQKGQGCAHGLMSIFEVKQD